MDMMMLCTGPVSIKVGGFTVGQEIWSKLQRVMDFKIILFIKRTFHI